jgi:hypothetical protein
VGRVGPNCAPLGAIRPRWAIWPDKGRERFGPPLCPSLLRWGSRGFALPRFAPFLVSLSRPLSSSGRHLRRHRTPLAFIPNASEGPNSCAGQRESFERSRLVSRAQSSPSSLRSLAGLANHMRHLSPSRGGFWCESRSHFGTPERAWAQPSKPESGKWIQAGELASASLSPSLLR